MEELISNLHMHTVYSDGKGTHADLALAAAKAGVDILIVTDHNVLVNGVEGYYKDGDRRVLLLTGEEIHDRTRLPQKSHLLVIGANRELTSYAQNPQLLIDAARNSEGLSFLAHPYEDALPMFGEEAITWEDWQTSGYTGLEIWNGLSELKTVIKSPLEAMFYGLFPQYVAHQPSAQTLAKWDHLLAAGNRIVAVGGSDAHALKIRIGPIQRTIFPYEFHFGSINTHLLVPKLLSGDLNNDRRMIYDALKRGNVFVGYDLPAPTRGFHFTAQGKDQTAIMGDEVSKQSNITLQIRLPRKCECRLLKDGNVVKIWRDRDICAYHATQPGVYRVECYLEFLGKQRGWIFSNPIYFRS
jgi:hypothetical protein